MLAKGTSSKLASSARKKDLEKLKSAGSDDAQVAAALAGDVGARLNLKAKQIAKKQEMAVKKAAHDVKKAAQPTIDERSKAIQRPGGVEGAHDRLYEEKKEKEEKAKKLKEAWDEKAKYDKDTGKKLGSPMIPDSSRKVRAV